MHVQPYLFFDGCCEQALEYYRQAVGAEVTTLMGYKDNPDPPPPGTMPPGTENKVMHASVRIGDSEIYASDGHCQGQHKFKGFRLSLTVKTDAEAEQYFATLSEGGQVQMPLSKTFYSSSFGMLSDRFGVSWMVLVEP